jgi:DNA-binding winged helix-turn-helix (wHTH) protein
MQPGAATEVIRFSGFTLDVSSGELKRNGTQTYLRPKAQAVLVPLARNKGRVISKDELMDTAWPGVFVTEDSLTQSIREVRESLGDTGQTLVRTISKRGYLLADETPLEEDDCTLPLVAVLRFRNETGDHTKTVLVDGLAEDIIDDHAKFRTATVLARQSSFYLRCEEPEDRAVARSRASISERMRLASSGGGGS